MIKHLSQSIYIAKNPKNDVYQRQGADLDLVICHPLFSGHDSTEPNFNNRAVVPNFGI